MVTGFEALAEAARLEQARIYSQATPEFRRRRIVEEDQQIVDELSRRRAQKATARQRTIAQQRRAEAQI